MLKKIVYFTLTLFILVSCTTIRMGERIEDYQDEIQRLHSELEQNPQNYDALRDLTVILVRTNQNERAQTFLSKAEEINPNDPVILFHSGLNYEFLNQKQKAMQYYQKYPQVSFSSPYKKLMQGRFMYLNRQNIYRDILQQIQYEQGLQIDQRNINAIGVFPFNYQGLEEKYAPLGRGLSEMISIDLGKVKQLTVLERVRLQALQDELALSRSLQIDQATAPRLGKILGAGRIISGSLNVVAGRDLIINLGSWEVISTETLGWIIKKDDLKRFFQVEKELVFDYLQKNGIELTKQERDDISYIPTENMEAFLSFCRGLLLEDEGKYPDAARFFQRASALDPEFKPASEKAEQSSAIGQTAGSEERMVSVVQNTDPIKTSITVEEDPVNSRLQVIETGVASNFIPGIDNRKPAEENENSKGINNLPQPPPPPKK